MRNAWCQKYRKTYRKEKYLRTVILLFRMKIRVLRKKHYQTIKNKAEDPNFDMRMNNELMSNGVRELFNPRLYCTITYAENKTIWNHINLQKHQPCPLTVLVITYSICH